ncbi:MAG: hypothetical protein HYY85_21375 [Deltaproteobacteria bacterium]|nr:hypothetical protein [Deltaproteobacteria bacterium]
MPFAYYDRLTPAQQRTYRRSDGITALVLPDPGRLRPLVGALADALGSGDRARTRAAADALLSGLCSALGMKPLGVEVLAVRPSRSWGELHGLYTPAEGGEPALVTVWMRTARRRQVVRFRTFLRTLLHELCHHADYELLGLEESFHTEGFYKRESSLFHQLVGREGLPPNSHAVSSGAAGGPRGAPPAP